MFSSLMGDGFDDLMGGHMRQMQSMMNSMFGNPFGNDMFAGGGSRSSAMMPFENDRMLSPFGFPHLNQLMRGMPSDPNCHSFSSSSVMTMTTGPDGKPQVYQASSSTRAGPGGVRETKKSVCDSRTGLKKLSIGHHIGERAHIKEREQNMYSGEREENDEFINLDEEEADQFHSEWQRKAQQYQRPRSHPAIGYRQNQGNSEYLALPPSSSAEPEHSLKEESQQKKKDHRSKPYNKRKEKKNHE